MVSYDLACQLINSDKDQWLIKYFLEGAPNPKEEAPTYYSVKFSWNLNANAEN